MSRCAGPVPPQQPVELVAGRGGAGGAGRGVYTEAGRQPGGGRAVCIKNHRCGWQQSDDIPHPSTPTLTAPPLPSPALPRWPQVSAWAPNPRDAPGELLALSRPVGHPDRAYSTLRQLLLDTSAGVPRKYRVLARLVDYVPQHPAQMCHPAVAAGLPGGGRVVFGVLWDACGCPFKLGLRRAPVSLARHGSAPTPVLQQAIPPSVCHPCLRRPTWAVVVHPQTAAGGRHGAAGRNPVRARRRHVFGGTQALCPVFTAIAK